MSKEEYNKLALQVKKYCEEEGMKTYEACMKRSNENFPYALPGQHQFYCLNQKRMRETFCLHEAKEIAGITSSDFRSPPQ